MIIGVICIVLGFQNCSQSALSTEDYNANLNTDNGTVIASVVSVQIGSNLLEDVDDTSALSIDVDSGEIRTPSGETYCLSLEDKQQLQSILASPKICKVPVSLPENTLCHTSMVPGYALLTSKDSQKSLLGGASDGCGHNSKRLCGEQEDLMRNFVAHLNDNLDSMACTR